jgi:hypothetical protein
MITSIEQIDEKEIEKLPSVIQNLLKDVRTVDAITKIAEANEVDDEVEVEMLEDEVMLILVGVNYVEDLKENLVWNIRFSEDKAHAIALSIESQIFSEVRKFLKHKTPVTSKVVESEDISHHNILGEIENPTPSLKPYVANNDHKVEAVTVMPKEARELMSQFDTLPTETTKSPLLQEAVAVIMPSVGGFKPLDDTLKPSQNISDGLDTKMDSVTKTPIKEVYMPKKPDPYREAI